MEATSHPTHVETAVASFRRSWHDWWRSRSIARRPTSTPLHPPRRGTQDPCNPMFHDANLW